MNKNEIRYHTDHIRQLREWLSRYPSMMESIGQFAKFRMVVDANFVIRNIVQHVRYPERGTTALEEMIQATIIEVHAPVWLETEVAAVIPKIAAQRKLSEGKLWECWQEFRTLLKWDETSVAPPGDGDFVGDPKDLPYVILEKAINAVGVLSQDHDIEKMGGNRLTLDFVFSVRQYARAAVVTVGIRVGAYTIGAITLGAFIRLFVAIRNAVIRLPSGIKVILIAGVMFAILHPPTRQTILRKLRAISPTLEGLQGVLVEAVIEGTKLSQGKLAEASTHLQMASLEIDKAKKLKTIVSNQKTTSSEAILRETRLLHARRPPRSAKLRNTASL